MTRISGLRRSLLPAAAPQGPAEGPVVAVPMTAVDRRRVRRRVRAPDGAELLLAFPTGTVLVPGTVLQVRDGRRYVVSAAPEDVAVLRPRSLAEAAALGHATGNLHRDLVVDGDEFLTLWDAPMELLLTRLGVPFTRERRAFLGRPSWEHA